MSLGFCGFAISSPPNPVRDVLVTTLPAILSGKHADNPGGGCRMNCSLCETCAWMREVVTPKGSRFLLCQKSQTDPAYPKYPRQPVVRCEGYRKKEQTGEAAERGGA